MDASGEAVSTSVVAPFVVQLRGRLADQSRHIAEHGELLIELRNSTHTATSKATTLETLHEKLSNTQSDMQSRLVKLEERLEAWIKQLHPIGVSTERRFVGCSQGESPKEPWKLHTTTASSAADRRSPCSVRRPTSNPPSARLHASTSSKSATALASALSFSPAKKKQLAELVDMPAVAKECDVETELLDLRGRLLVIEAALEDYLPKQSETEVLPFVSIRGLTSSDRAALSNVVGITSDGDSRNSFRTRIPEELMQSRLTSVDDSCCQTIFGGATDGACNGREAAGAALRSAPRHGRGPRASSADPQRLFLGPTSALMRHPAPCRPDSIAL